MNYKLFFLVLSILLLNVACESDDDYIPIDIEANTDNIIVNQNESVEIFILQNDQNLPDLGSITISSPSKGTVDINDNNTPNNPSDDSLLYTTGSNKVGEDTFQYTICNDVNNCGTGTVTVNIISISNINYSLDALPYQNLSEYNFFQGNLKDLVPNYGVLPYSLNSSLFTDYAKKKRFVWLPGNTNAVFIDDDSLLDFPVGAILIKNFYYDNVLPDYSTKIIETRLMIKKSEGWVFAEYVWNDEQTEAILDLEGSIVNVEWEQDQEVKNIQYRIPNEAECVICHKVNEVPFPIGTKPRNLNLSNLYDGNMQNQLEKWKEFGYLSDFESSSSVSSTPDYNDDSVPLENRVRAYLDINCAHCHIDLGHCDYRPLRLDYTSSSDYANLGVCVTPDENLGEGLGEIIIPGDSRFSVLHFRMNSTDESNRMPLLGRTIVHTEGIDLIEEWIDGLNVTCD
jgi:uncharacterized repeat protein (TIGR03806 family)